jgi:site-specific recombinase XerD
MRKTKITFADAGSASTILKMALERVEGFDVLYRRFERKMSIAGRSKATITNYGRHIAAIALHFQCLPTELDQDQLEDYLFLLQSKENRTPSESYFKFTVFGLRCLFKIEGLEHEHIVLPSISADSKLPSVLSQSEVKAMIASCTLLKHRLMIALMYGCGLRIGELVSLEIKNIDLQRGMLHVVQGKGRKDRYVPLGAMLCRGIAAHIEAEHPKKWLFTGKESTVPMSTRGTTWVVNEAVRKCNIRKDVSCHTLRHSYATHLLEMGLDIMSIKDLLGHERIETTLVYLHVAQNGRVKPFSPLDKLYTQG